MRNLSYQIRLKRWRINRLEDRRVRGDLIEIYKSVNGLDEINWERNPVINTPKVVDLTKSNGVRLRGTLTNQKYEMIWRDTIIS